MSGTVVGSGSKNKIKNCSHESYIVTKRHGFYLPEKMKKNVGFSTLNQIGTRRKERKGKAFL